MIGRSGTIRLRKTQQFRDVPIKRTPNSEYDHRCGSIFPGSYIERREFMIFFGRRKRR
jgi:hypothetical protein